MATVMEQASERFFNIPSMFAANLPFVFATTTANWLIDMIVGPPNEFSELEWEYGAFTQNLKDSAVVATQDVVKYSMQRWAAPWREDIVPPPGSGAEGAPTINLAYY
jgi:hypothetical protein